MCIKDRLIELEEKIAHTEYLIQYQGSEEAKEVLPILREKLVNLQDEQIRRLLREE